MLICIKYMEKAKRNIIPLLILLLVFVIPLFFDNRLMNVNTIHRFLFSTLTFVLCIFLCPIRIKHFVSTDFKIIFTSAAIFLFFILISSLVSDRFILSIEDFTIYFNIFVFAYLVFLCFKLYDFNTLLYNISFVITIVCLIISILGILEFFNINLLNFPVNSRPGSTLSIRNFASEYAVISFPFLFVITLKKKNIFLYIFSALASIIILSFIFFCRTRSSFVALFIYIVIITIYFIKIKFNNGERSFVKEYIIFIIIIIISFFIGTYSAPNIDKSRVDLNNTVLSLFDKHYPENSARINYWKTSLRIFKKDPITGIGAGSWFGIYPNYNKYIYNDKNILETSEINPHNDYFEILSENGIFGFIFFSLILLVVLRNLFFETLNNINILPILLAFSGFLTLSALSFPKDNVSISIFFSVIIGISLSINKLKYNSEEANPNIKIPKKIMLSLLALILLIVSVNNFMKYNYEIYYISGIRDKNVGNYKSMIEKLENINYLIYPVDANSMPIEFYKGVGYFELKNYQEALNSFKNALKLAPYVPVIRSNLASTFYMLKDNENAIKLLTEMKNDFPFFIEPQINLLSIYTNTGKDSLAIGLLNYISQRELDSKSIRNYFILEKIKAHYNEKNSP